MNTPGPISSTNCEWASPSYDCSLPTGRVSLTSPYAGGRGVVAGALKQWHSTAAMVASTMQTTSPTLGGSVRKTTIVCLEAGAAKHPRQMYSRRSAYKPLTARRRTVGPRPVSQCCCARPMPSLAIVGRYQPTNPPAKASKRSTVQRAVSRSAVHCTSDATTAGCSAIRAWVVSATIIKDQPPPRRLWRQLHMLPPRGDASHLSAGKKKQQACQTAGGQWSQQEHTASSRAPPMPAVGLRWCTR